MKNPRDKRGNGNSSTPKHVHVNLDIGKDDIKFGKSIAGNNIPSRYSQSKQK